MKRILYVILAVVFISSGRAMADDATSTSSSKPGVMNAAASSVTATVVDINYDTRMVTLKGPDGAIKTMVAGPEVTRLNAIKKGDVVKMTYMQTVEIVMQSPDQSGSTTEGSSSAIVRSTGTQPSAMVVRSDVITATVEKIDVTSRTATLKGPKGNTMVVHVAEDVPNLENVKPGDQIQVRVTRSVAIKVSTPGKS